MSLPSLIEYILSVPSPTGGNAAEDSLTQYISAEFPPNTTLSTSIRPPQSIYANIGYRVAFSNYIVPEAFTTRIQMVGHTFISITSGGGLMGYEFDSFVVITKDNPLNIIVTNVSGLVQYVEFLYRYVVIYSAENYVAVLNAVKDYGNLGSTAQQNQANMLLQRMLLFRPPLAPVRS